MRKPTKLPKRTICLLSPLLLLYPLPSKANIFESFGNPQDVVSDILGDSSSLNPSDVFRDIIKQKDPIKKGRKSDDSTIEERNVYKEVSVRDLYEVSTAIHDLVSGGKLNTFLKAILSVLGESGGLDPGKNRTILGSENRPDTDPVETEGNDSSTDGQTVSDVVLQDPVSPRSIAENQFRIDTATNETPRLSSKLILSEEGQDILAAQGQETQQAIADSQKRYQASSSAGEDSGQESLFATQLAKEAQGLAEQAQGRKSSQDVLKDTAAIASKQSFALQSLAKQQTALSVGLRELSAQVDALNKQSGIQSQKLTTMQILTANQVEQLGSILNIDMHQQQMEVNDRKIHARAAFAVNTSFFLPGFDEVGQ